MRKGIRLTRDNIYLVVLAKDLYNDMIDARFVHKRAGDKRWLMSFLVKMKSGMTRQ